MKSEYIGYDPSMELAKRIIQEIINSGDRELIVRQKMLSGEIKIPSEQLDILKNKERAVQKKLFLDLVEANSRS